MQGKLFYLIGASGSGKDTLIQHAQKILDPERFVFMQRYITRPKNIKAEHGVNEDYFYLSQEEFSEKQRQGLFVLFWHSHNYFYGISKELNNYLAENKNVIINGSRGYLEQAIEKYPDLIPILVEVKPEILKNRLLNRGREQKQEITDRLSSISLPVNRPCLKINNSGSFKDCLATFLTLLNQY